MKYYSILALFLLIVSHAFSDDAQLINHFEAGPEGYWVKRVKEGGTRQKGMLWGGRITYERIKRYGWYLGADALYATGKLHGKSNLGQKIASTLTDENVEGRFGYTLQCKNDYGFSWTPFFGYGYFRETNRFHHPTPIPIHFNNQFTYIPFGFLSHVYFNPDMGIGLNVKIRYLLKHKLTATNDPQFHRLTLHYHEQLQYRIELPMNYDFCCYNRLWQITLVPFYEQRDYGHLANYPFDFLKTKFQIYGANLQFVCLF